MSAVRLNELAHEIWSGRYRADADDSVEATWRRVAGALASVERDQRGWAQRFREILDDFVFLPGGRIVAGAGSADDVTLCNCFVMGRIEDSIPGIFHSLSEGAQTMRAGGGVGYDFSTLRPKGCREPGSRAAATGPVAMMAVWDAMCDAITASGARRGAMMGTLRCDHPDIEAFVEAKLDGRSLSRFNCSVLVTDAFMAAVAEDVRWPLLFPADGLAEQGGPTVARRWTDGAEVACRVFRDVNARSLWSSIMQSAYGCSEPGVVFIDRVNAANNLAYTETILTTNPCGEVPLPEYGVCNLGSFNLAKLVRRPFTAGASFDHDRLRALVPVALRMLDNAIDVSRYPLPAQARQARQSRRVGLGFTGLADALIMLNLHYADAAARREAARIARAIRDAAYDASARLAAEKGSFPTFIADRFLATGNALALPDEIKRSIERFGMRNSHLVAVAPAGSISLLADNVSSGIEPVFALEGHRQVRTADGGNRRYRVLDHAYRRWRDAHPQRDLPAAFVTADRLKPGDHLAMMAAVQPFVDQAIAKTVNVPGDIEFDEFAGLYETAYELGLKGCTVFRPQPNTVPVLERD